MMLAWLACATDVVEAPPEPVARFPAGRSPQERDARPSAYTHEAPGPCASCHSAEAAAWAGSSHDLALTDPDLALGLFDGQPRDLGSLTATPFLEDGERLVEVRDGQGTDRLQVVHAFGHAPLQQLLLEGEAGALYVAPLAWDVARGVWFDPSTEGASGDPADPLYWRGLFGTWNHACASCHSTGVVEAFSPDSGYATTSTHPDVACQACHGEGPEVRTLARGAEEIDTCATCHSLRASFHEGWSPGAPLLDHYLPALLDDPVWSPDGRLVDDREVFEWGSFVQSGMYAAGVRCTDCHDPHTAGLRQEGDALCLACHPPSYAAVAHGYGEGSCVDCHAPTKTYMGIDDRHDHAFGHDGDRLGRLVTAARAGDPDVAAPLLALASSDDPDFHRASAISLLARTGPPGTADEVLGLLDDRSDLVRWRTVGTLAAWGVVEPLWPLLDDPIRAVRVAAAQALVTQRPPSPVAGASLAAARAEWQAGMEAEADEPAHQLNLGMLARLDGDDEAALSHFRAAVGLAPSYEPARRALAGALGRAGRIDEAKAALAGDAP